MKTLKSQGHEFLFQDPSFLLHKLPSGSEQRFPYDELLRIRKKTFSGEIQIRSRRCSTTLSVLSREQLGDFLSQFFQAWSAKAPEAAKKAAFDYVDEQRGFTGIALITSLIFSLPVAVALLADSHQQFSCTKELEANAVPGEIAIVKATKKDSRSFKIKMEFRAPSGEIIKAEDLVRTRNEKDIPKALPIFYSPERPICWTLTKGLDSSEIPWAKRRYFSWFTLLFGLFFLSAAVLGLAWSVLKRSRTPPFSDEMRTQFGLK